MIIFFLTIIGLGLKPKLKMGKIFCDKSHKKSGNFQFQSRENRREMSMKGT